MGCTKKSHPSLEMALAHIDMLRRLEHPSRHARLSAYQCRDPNRSDEHWHVGHDRPVGRRRGKHARKQTAA